MSDYKSEDVAVGTIWQHKKKADQVIILARVGLFGVNYRRYPTHENSDFNRERKKLLHYFLYEYTLITPSA